MNPNKIQINLASHSLFGLNTGPLNNMLPSVRKFLQFVDDIA
jgi:hypothetical protein